MPGSVLALRTWAGDGRIQLLLGGDKVINDKEIPVLVLKGRGEFAWQGKEAGTAGLKGQGEKQQPVSRQPREEVRGTGERWSVVSGSGQRLWCPCSPVRKETPPPIHPSLLFPRWVYMSILNVCVSVPALQITSLVPFF